MTSRGIFFWEDRGRTPCLFSVPKIVAPSPRASGVLLFWDTGNRKNDQLSLFQLAAKNAGAKFMTQPYADGSGL